MKVNISNKDKQKFLDVAEAAEKNPNTPEEVLHAMDTYKPKQSLIERLIPLQEAYDYYMRAVSMKLREHKTLRDFSMTEGLNGPPQWNTGELPEHNETCRNNCICKKRNEI